MLEDSEALQYMKMLEKWDADLIDDARSRDMEFLTLEEYFDHRMLTIGTYMLHELMLYVCNIKLTRAKLDQLKPALRVAYEHVSFTNDFFSVQADWLTHAKLDLPGVPVSSVFLIMRLRGIPVGEAKEIVRAMALKSDVEFLRLRKLYAEQFKGTPEQSEVERYISSLQNVISGNLVYHLNSQRYEPVGKDHIFYVKPEHRLCDLPRWSKPQINRAKSASPVQRGKDEILKQRANKPEEASNAAPWLAQYAENPEKIILEPIEYITSLPSKKIRDRAIEALDAWYDVPQESLDIIASIIDLLHSSSLIVDDNEDNSVLRRGHPAAHMIFGVPQAINSANYLFVKCLQKVQQLSPSAIAVFADELANLHLGQSLDLHWSFHVKCPTEAEYIKMIDGKTGGLFRMAGSLMRAEARRNRDLDIKYLLTLMCRFFQIRDDYQNLRCENYAAAKGDLSDLDERKYSFMLIHALNHIGNSSTQLSSLLRLRSTQGSLSPEQKTIIMRALVRAKSIDYTFKVLKELEEAIEKTLQQLESQSGIITGKNWIIRAIMARLRVVA
ncbi:hypothetical protein TWF694_003702 [Orbilia ellipsospora]|uniref:Geranylgeranyl pyrophosphate synthase n=1 Tax=Orbilia ellipsospora TaxID=2528407 RepID=A0AAV9X173_9PEZI